MAEVADLAWAAGLIDGEGCVLIAKRSERDYQLRLTVAMVHKPTLDRLRSIFGVGNVRPHVGARPDGWRQKWVWLISARQALAVLELVRPFMITKAGEADLALQFAHTFEGTKKGRALTSEVLEARESLFRNLQVAKQYAFEVQP